MLYFDNIKIFPAINASIFFSDASFMTCEGEMSFMTAVDTSTMDPGIPGASSLSDNMSFNEEDFILASDQLEMGSNVLSPAPTAEKEAEKSLQFQLDFSELTVIWGNGNEQTTTRNMCLIFQTFHSMFSRYYYFAKHTPL